MTEEEWLAAYILQFGEATIFNVGCQPGEAEFLIEMGKQLGTPGKPVSAWYVIRDTYERTKHGERTPQA